MVTIWPSFISCLITSLALTDILWARSATLIVSGMCTSCTCCSGCAVNALPPPSRSPRRPAAPRGARQPGRAAVSVRPLSAARFLAASSAQLEESFSDLTCFFSPGLAAAAAGAPAAVLGLWMVPLMASLPGSAGLGSSGFLATSTLRGADIMARMAAASASAALRRRSSSA